ncbi:hypothetical protein HDU97_002226 [Phlyctochytrium planicorne]|nr:hypothetical protein HDU97_002226 [Phlyctochytrium planicorne]
MELNWEWIPLVGTAITSILWYEAKQKYLSIASAVPYPSTSSGLAELIKDHESWDKKYVVIAGAVKALPDRHFNITSSAGTSVKAVLLEVLHLLAPESLTQNKTSMVRHFARWSEAWREWFNSTQILSTTFNSVPFHVALPDEVGFVNVNVEPTAIEKIELDVPVLSSTFEPMGNGSSVAQMAVDMLQGERNLGLETIKRGLVEGSPVTEPANDYFDKILLRAIENSSIKCPLLAASDYRTSRYLCRNSGSKGLDSGEGVASKKKKGSGREKTKD